MNALVTDNPAKHHAGRLVQVMRWIARIVSLLATAAWALIMLDIILCEVIVGCITITWETGFLVFLVATSLLSVVLAWHREDIGGVAMLLWGLVLTMIAYATSRPYEIVSMLATGIPFMVAGALFLASWWKLHSAAE